MGNEKEFRDLRNRKIDNEAEKKKNKGSLPTDMQKALEYGVRACDLDVMSACANVARLVFHFFSSGPYFSSLKYLSVYKTTLNRSRKLFFPILLRRILGCTSLVMVYLEIRTKLKNI